MFKLDYFAVLIAIAAIVALSLWPLKSHGEGDHEEDHGDAGRYGEVQWSYLGTNSQKNCGSLSPDFTSCKAGWAQPTIEFLDTTTAIAVAATFHDLHHQGLPLKIFLDGHTV